MVAFSADGRPQPTPTPSAECADVRMLYGIACGSDHGWVQKWRGEGRLTGRWDIVQFQVGRANLGDIGPLGAEARVQPRCPFIDENDSRD